MNAIERTEKIVAWVNEQGFVSVKVLSQSLGVSQVTIRRDLQRLQDDGRLIRIHGGAAPRSTMHEKADAQGGQGSNSIDAIPAQFLMEQVDVLVAVSLSPGSDLILSQRAAKHQMPIIAESLAMENARTLIAPDNYEAARELGRWAGEYVARHFGSRPEILDLTYHLSNTQDRSRGFLAGLRDRLPQPKKTLSLNTYGDYQSAYQLTADVLQAYPGTNVIFGINDVVTRGAIQACRDQAVDPDAIVVVTFGMEGETLKDELLRRDYLKAGLAMFPEIVGPICVEAAVAAFNQVDLPQRIFTPHAVVTADNIGDSYRRLESGWQLRSAAGGGPVGPKIEWKGNTGITLPKAIGFPIPFADHEWYINLADAMKHRARRLGIDLMLTDAAENFREEMVLRRLNIAAEASKLVQPGDVILIDGGQETTFLAQALAGKKELTVITNAMSVIDALRNEPGISLIATGGLLGNESQIFGGPIAESIFREIRAGKLFLTAAGVSLDFGLSHTNLADGSMKQAMIRAAREVILLADHSKFEQESVVHVAQISVVDRLITDNALPAKLRLDLSRQGIEVSLAQA